MEVVPVREFLNFTPQELFDGLKTNLNVQFDDGVLPMSSREIIFSRFVWDVFKRLDQLPLLKRHAINQYYTNNMFTSGSISGILETIFRDVVDVYCRPTNSREVLNDYLYEKIQDIYNDIYNVIICNSLEYCTSIDIIDFLEIQFQPKLLNAIKQLNHDKSEKAVSDVYKVLDEVITKSPELANNKIVKGYISGTYNKNQVNQILGCRGFVAELNSAIFKEPIVSPLVLGMRSAYEVAVESKTAAKSLFVSHEAIKQSEYLARTLQLVSMRMERLIDGDCGSKDYMLWSVDADSITGKSELPLLVGKRYLDEEDGVEKIITKNDTHLIGKVIKLRSPLKCKHTHAGCCCVACLGDMSYSVPYPSNLGHMMSTFITQMISQSILSTKHITGSAQSIEFEIGPEEAAFLKKVSKNGIGFKHKAFNTKKFTYELIVGQERARGLNGLGSSYDVEELAPSKLSRIDEVYLKVTDGKGYDNIYPLKISFTKSVNKNNNSKSSTIYGYFTSNFLKYLLNKEGGKPRYSLANGNEIYVISLNDWIDMEASGSNKFQDEELEDMDQTQDGSDENEVTVKRTISKVFEFPTVEYSFLQLTDEVRSLVRGIDPEDSSVEKMVQSLFNLLNVRLSVNIALIEIMVCAFTVKNRDLGDYHLGRNISNRVDKISNILYHGSNVGIYAFEYHKVYMLLPTTFNGNNNVDHPLDGLICPQETYEQARLGRRG